jgi:hypothetical protein
MKSALAIRNSTLLSYVYFNPLFRASRSVRRKLRKYLHIHSKYRPKTV